MHSKKSEKGREKEIMTYYLERIFFFPKRIKHSGMILLLKMRIHVCEKRLEFSKVSRLSDPR